MEEVELLVHISAALRRQDDQRFLDIAQSIIDFEPVTLIRNGNANDSEQEATGDASPGHQLLPSSSLSDDDGSHSPTPGADSALKSIRRPSLTGSTTSNPGKAQRRPSTENLNPPYRNPYHGVRPLEKPQLLFETPSQSHRPRTAPERPNTVQVPRTGPNFRRTQSESSSFGSLASHISNSQPSNKSDVREEEDSTAPPSSNWLRGGAQEDHRGVTRSLSQTSLDSRQTPYKRRKLLGQDTEVKVIPRPPISRAFLLLDRSLDWTSSLESSQTQSSSVPSTATVSQSLQENASMEEQDKATPPVILISSESSKQGDGRLTQQGGLASSSSHTRMLEVVPISGGSPDTSQQIIKMPLFERLGLKPNVSAPQPNVSEERFVTHITTHLQDLASQLPFERFFRPVEVTRDVKVLERGYWLLDVQIVSDEAAEAARSVEKIKGTGPNHAGTLSRCHIIGKIEKVRGSETQRQPIPNWKNLRDASTGSVDRG